MISPVSNPKGVAYVVIGSGDVTTSGPMGDGLRYLSTSGQVGDDSVHIVAGPPPPGGRPDTEAAFLGRVQGGRAPLSDAQLAGYRRMTGLDPRSAAALPACDVTNPKQLVDTLAPLIGDSDSVVVYFGLPPGTFLGGLDGVAALQRKFPDKTFVTLLEKPYGKSSQAARTLEQKSQESGGPVLSIDHFLAYPGNLAARQLLSQPMFQEVLNNRYIDHGVVRMDEGPDCVGADRSYMRGLGWDDQARRDHGGVAEDMLQSHGWVGLLTPVLGDVLEHVHVDPSSIVRGQVDTFNHPDILKNPALKPSTAATRVSTGFTVDTPDMHGVPWVMWANKGVAIEPDANGRAPQSWFGSQLHVKALPAALARHLSDLSGRPVSTSTPGTLNIRVDSDPKVSFTPDHGGAEIQLLPPGDVTAVPPEATLLLDAAHGQTGNFSNAHLENEGWRLTDAITDHFAHPDQPGYVTAGSYPLKVDVRLLPTRDPRLFAPGVPSV